MLKPYLEESYPRISDFIPDVSIISAVKSPPHRQAWVKLNRRRTVVSRFNFNMDTWSLVASAACECGTEVQTSDNIVLECPKHWPVYGGIGVYPNIIGGLSPQRKSLIRPTALLQIEQRSAELRGSITHPKNMVLTPQSLQNACSLQLDGIKNCCYADKTIFHQRIFCLGPIKKCTPGFQIFFAR